MGLLSVRLVLIGIFQNIAINYIYISITSVVLKFGICAIFMGAKKIHVHLSKYFFSQGKLPMYLLHALTLLHD